MHRTEGNNHEDNMFKDGPPGTALGANWHNAVQEEIANVIESEGIDLLKADTDTRGQLLTAFDKRFKFRGGCLVYSTGVKVLTTGVFTSINFAAESYDADDYHDNAVNNTRITIPTGVTFGRLTGWVEFEAGINNRILRFNKNGVADTTKGTDKSVIASVAATLTTLKVQTAIVQVAATDYFELVGWHDNGADLDVVDAWFTFERTNAP